MVCGRFARGNKSVYPAWRTRRRPLADATGAQREMPRLPGLPAGQRQCHGTVFGDALAAQLRILPHDPHAKFELAAFLPPPGGPRPPLGTKRPIHIAPRAVGLLR